MLFILVTEKYYPLVILKMHTCMNKTHAYMCMYSTTHMHTSIHMHKYRFSVQKNINQIYIEYYKGTHTVYFSSSL